MYPQDPMQPQQSSSVPPVSQQPFSAPTGSMPPRPDPESSRNMMPFIIGGAVALVLIIITVVVIAMSGSSKNKSSGTNDTQSSQNSSQVSGAATSLSVQQSSDALSQSLSTLDDNSDYPKDVLSPATFGDN